MQSSSRPVVSLFVDKSQQQWIVRDPDGNFWLVPPGENPWNRRVPYDPTTSKSQLIPIPGHYKYLLNLPF